VAELSRGWITVSNIKLIIQLLSNRYRIFQHCLRRSLAISFLPRDPIAVACDSRARDGLSTLNFLNSRQFRALRKSINHSRPIDITESRLISIFSSTKEISS